MSIITIVNAGNVLIIELYGQNKRTIQCYRPVGHRVHNFQLFIGWHVVLRWFTRLCCVHLENTGKGKKITHASCFDINNDLFDTVIR